MRDSHFPLGIVIPVHNGVDFTVRCLTTLSQAEGPSRLVIIVDDGSSDGTAQRLAEAFPHVLVIPGTGDLWWSRSVDLGCRVAIALGAHRVVLMNNDNVECSKNVLVELCALLDRRGGCASATAIARHGSEDVILHAGGELNWRRRGIRLRQAGELYRERDGEAACDWLPGTALAFSKELFLELGGFDSAMPQYRGDVDFTARARERGHACTVSYRCWVVNDKSQTGLSFDRRVSLGEFLAGFVSLRSNYNVRETLRFAARHCPARWRAFYLAQFYSRYVYAFVKSQLIAPPTPTVGAVGARE